MHLRSILKTDTMISIRHSFSLFLSPLETDAYEVVYERWGMDKEKEEEEKKYKEDEEENK